MTRIAVLTGLLGILAGGAMQEDRDRAIRLATDTLARHLKVAGDKIRLISAEAVDWPNPSLGCPQEGRSYPQVIVSGFRVRLAVGERQYNVHTGSGRAVICDDKTKGSASAVPGITILSTPTGSAAAPHGSRGTSLR